MRISPLIQWKTIRNIFMLVLRFLALYSEQAFRLVALKRQKNTRIKNIIIVFILILHDLLLYVK